MARWQYRITIHTTNEILELIPEIIENPPATLFCDVEGSCYFESEPNPFTKAVEDLLNNVGDDGWELVQVAFRSEQLVCFWKKLST